MMVRSFVVLVCSSFVCLFGAIFCSHGPGLYVTKAAAAEVRNMRHSFHQQNNNQNKTNIDSLIRVLVIFPRWGCSVFWLYYVPCTRVYFTLSIDDTSVRSLSLCLSQLMLSSQLIQIYFPTIFLPVVLFSRAMNRLQNGFVQARTWTFAHHPRRRTEWAGSNGRKGR